jgi:hypothetical protein
MGRMRLEEAMKKATPGKMSVKRIDIGSHWLGNHVILIPGDGNRIRTVTCICQHGAPAENETNAALLAHWYNVGPKLLEAVKNLKANFNYENTETLLNVIKECEEVDGI